MWCGTEVKKALCFVPEFAGFHPGYSHQIGKPHDHQTHHHKNENEHHGGRFSDTNRIPYIRVAIKPDRMGRGDSGYRKCSTCTYERGASCNQHQNVRAAGLTSEEMWRVMRLDGHKNEKENKTSNSSKDYYSRHDSHYPSNYRHYEGFRGGHGREHCHNFDHGHYHHTDSECYDNHDHGHHDLLDRRLHHHHHHLYSDSHKHKKDKNASRSACQQPKMPRGGNFYVPMVSGDYDRERNRICFQLPNTRIKKGESSRDGMDYHNKTHDNLDQDYCKTRYYCPDPRSGKKSHRGSSRNGAKPHCVGIIAGLFCVGDAGENSSGRVWRGNCC